MRSTHGCAGRSAGWWSSAQITPKQPGAAKRPSSSSATLERGIATTSSSTRHRSEMRPSSTGSPNSSTTCPSTRRLAESLLRAPTPVRPSTGSPSLSPTASASSIAARRERSARARSHDHASAATTTTTAAAATARHLNCRRPRA
ncbi:MAG: hypothetical protein IPN32_29970 [Deltaproteobacteria bacterium]|nr:hypothetical protein [Deltaproteobacteria bacterium]